MVASICHESFYRAGTWIDESLGVYVGWAARENSFSDGMPVCNETGDVVLVFAGEEFPEPGTAVRLKQRGHVLGTEGASYLAHLYEEDPRFPAGLNGRFHGLAMDRRAGTAMLFNDRFGMQRIYYHESDEAFYFAAEAKAILAVCPKLRAIDSRSLGEFVSCGCVLENRTLFQGVQVLPGASAWVFRNGSAERKANYFEPSEWENQSHLDAESYYQELREVFSQTLPRYFNGSERVGVSLTGGLDTRMIMAWAKPSPGSLPCYSFSGTYRDSQDVLLAKRIAEMCQQPHQNIQAGAEFLSQFPKYAERTVFLSDGCTEVACSPVLYANSRAREIAPVRMTGNYGSEVLRRAVAFKPGMPVPELYRPELLAHVRQAHDTYNRLIQCHPLSFEVFRQAPWHHYGLFALELTQLSVRSPFLDNSLVRAAFRAPESASVHEDVCLRLIRDGSLPLRRVRTDRGVAGDQRALSRAVSKGLLEFTFKAEYAYDYGMPQWVSRIDHLFSPFHLERLFLGRHKYYHFRVWYRDVLGKYVQDMLLDPMTLSRPFVQKQMVEKIVHGHLKGGLNYTSAIHQILTLELLHRLFID